MPYRLSWDAEALEALAHYRAHDIELHDAFQSQLNELRQTGMTRSRAYTSDRHQAFVTSVYVPGRAEHYAIVWRRRDEDRPAIVYLGPLPSN
jgi:hypothetical protein